MSDEDLLALAGSLRNEDRARKFQGALTTGAQFNPDEYAKAIKLSAGTGVVPTAVMRNMQDFDRPRIDPAEFVNMNPRTADWLAGNVNHAAVAHDDLDNLTRFERAAKDAASQILQIPQRAMGGVFRGIGGIASLEGSVMAQGMKPGAPLWAQAFNMAVNPQNSPDIAGLASNIGKDVRDYYKPLFTDPSLTPETTSGEVAGFVGNLAGTMGKAYVLGPFSPFAFGAEALGESGGTALERGATPGQAAVKALGSGTLNTALAFIPGGKFGSEQALGQAIAQGGKVAIAKELAKGIAARGIRGTALGTGVTVTENLLSRIYDPKTPIFEGLGENVASFIGLEGAGYLSHAVKLTAESRLKARSPETFKSALESTTQAQGLDQFTVPVDRMTTFFQETGLTPADFGESASKSYTQALASGTEVTLRTADFLSSKATPEQMDSLVPDARFHLNGPTLNEIQAYAEESDRIKSDIKSQAEPTDAGPQKSIYEETRAQLIDAGNSDRVADILADRHSRVMVNLAEKFGEDPLAVNERYGLRIYRPAPGEGQSAVDISLGRMGAAQDQAFGQSEPLAARLDRLRETLTLRNGANDGSGNLRANREPGTPGSADTQGTPGLDGKVSLAGDGGTGRRPASGREAWSRIERHTSAEGLDAYYRAPQVYTDPEPVVFKSWSGKEHTYHAMVDGRDVYVQDPTAHLPEGTNRSGIRLEVLPEGDLYVRIIHKGGVDGSGTFLYQEAIKLAMKHFPEVTRDSMVMGDTSADAVKTRQKMGSGTDVYDPNTDGISWTGVVSETPVRNFLDFQPDPLESKLRSLGVDITKATNEEATAKLSADPEGQIFFQSMKRNPQDYQRLRTRLASLRSLSPSAQSAELTRRSMEAKAREDEFLAWENGVKAVQAGEILPSDNRGFIQFSPDRKVSIALLEKADLTTFTHEVAHMYLEVFGDLATAEGAKSSGVEDYGKILDFLGVKDRSEVKTDHHEKFARAMETYAMEGKAPTPELRTAFQRVKFWMMQVYRSISDLGVKLNPEIRGVFDRMFAGEEAVSQAQQLVDLKPIFATPEAMGATQAEFDAYAKASAKAIGTARDAVESKLITELKREKEAWWKTESAKVTEEVTAEIDADPTYQAFKALREGKLEDGTPIKLNKAALEAQFGLGVGKELPRGWLRLYTREGGMDAEAAAEILGFQSGDRLIESLKAMEPRREAIKRLTEDRMKAQHGDMMTDGSLADAAVEALHNSAREDMLMAELRILRKKAKEMGPALELKALKGETAQQAKDREALSKAQGEMARQDRQQARAATEVPPIQAFREAAKELVEQTSIRDLEPYTYLLASRKAAREAFESMAKDDYQVAGDAKQKELLNHHLYLEATKARDEAQAISDYGKKGETAKFQARVGKAGGDYLAQWNALASRYEFRKVTNQELDARAQSLEAWATAQQAVGEGIVIDPSLYREDRVKNWREVPISELRAVHDALKNIETVARRQRQVLDGDKRADFETAVDEMDAGARGNLKTKPLPLDPLARSTMDKVVSIAKGMNAEIVKVERVIDHLDQGDINGPWRRYLFEPMALAQFKEYELNQKVTKSLADAIEAMPKDQRHSMLDIYDIPGMGKVTRKFILSMALNWGNAGNREKLVKGMGWTSTPEVVGKAFDKLNRADWEFVQKAWDAIDQLWPEIADLQRRFVGKEPPRVDREAFSVTLPDGSTMHLDGGYYPLDYDRTKSSQGAMQADNDIMNSEGGFQGPVTFKGHTKERVANFAAPLNLDFEQTLIRHISRVIKDVSHREAALSVSKLIRDQRVRQAISETMGPEYEAMLMPWLKGTVNDLGGQMGQDAGMWKTMLMTTRSNMVLAGLSFRAGSIVVQATDLGRAMTKVAPRHLGQALLDFCAHPIETTQAVRALSKEMLGRSENLDRDTRAMMKRTQGQDGWMHQVQLMGMQGLAWADTITSVTTWKGAYEQSLAEGKPNDQAIREADRTVRLTMMSSAPKDLVAVQRVGDVGMKFITMFMGDATAAYGTMNEGVRQIAMGKDTGSHLFKMAMVGMILPILGQLIKNRGPRDDEDKAWWATKNALLSLPSSIPIVRDIAQSLDSGQDYKFTPVANALDKAVKSARMAGKLAQGKAEWDDVFMHGFDAVGTLGGLPGTSQIMTSTNYLRDVKKGKKPAPKNAYEAVKNTLFGPPPKGK